MKYVKYSILFISILFVLLFSCVTTEKQPEPTAEPTAKPKPTERPLEIEKDIPALKDVLKDYFLIGAALEPGVLRNSAHQELLKKHFNSMTAENCMKPSSIHPKEDTYKFAAGDELVKFTQENNIAVRGHTLIWHNQCPDWFFKENKGPASKETLRARIKTHITEIMQHYKGKIYAWDVVNEAIDTGYPDGYRRSKWYEILGPEYIELAFKCAREADPAAKLIYNDYNVTDFNKVNKIIEMVKDFKARGIPIDGVGIQNHISMRQPYIQYIEKAIIALSALDIEIHITEMDINVYENERQSLNTFSQELRNEQGHRVKDCFDLFRKYKKITSVTFWGVADDYSWLQRSPVRRNNWPLPFDENLKAKPFYWGIVDPAKLSPRINTARVSEGTAVIDGIIDDSWEFTEYFPNIPTAGGLSADMKALWDKQYLYVLLNITDKTPAQDDVITFFIDEKNDKSENLDDNDRIIDFSLNKSFKNTADAAVKKTDSGYIFETRVAYKSIKGEKDMKLGFDTLIQSGEKTSIKWNDQKALKSTTPKYWGILECLTPPKSGIAYYGIPVLDGEKDKLYDRGKPFPITLFIYGIQGEEVSFSGAAGNAWVLWNEKALSVYIEVTDPVLSDASTEVYMQDSIEVFIDENNNKTTVYEKDDGQFRVNFKNKTSFGSTGSVDGFQSAAKIISGGYAVEVIIPFRTITGKENTIIGFDLQINDDHGSGKRDSITKWNDPSNDSWQSTAGFGLLIFKK